MTLIGDWDPDILFSPIQPKVSNPVYVDPLVLLAPARAMIVEVPTTSLGQGDCFLDDIIKIFLAHLSIFKKNAASVPLAIHVLMRPLTKDEPVPRKETLLLNKGLHALSFILRFLFMNVIYPTTCLLILSILLLWL